ncbi:MAG TPA: tetratricopeptide repeat protein [Rhodospirillaceae bacterium]|nr:tetratricopeptide repeat protein [Rhodospirillaceae bacterium]
MVPILALMGCALPDQRQASGTVVESTALSAAMSAEAVSDFRSAASNWDILYRQHPDDPAFALKLARALRYSGQVQPSIDTAASFLDRHPANPALLAELGKDYLAGDRLGLAVRVLRQAAEAAPGDWEPLSALAVALDYQHAYGEAQQVYARALVLAPDNPVLLNNLGLSLAEAGDLKKAEATLSKAVDQPKATAQVRQNLALIKALAGDSAAAERLARQDLPPEAVRSNGVYYRSLADGVKLR